MADMRRDYRFSASDGKMTQKQRYDDIDCPTITTREATIRLPDTSEKKEIVKLKKIVIGLGVALILTLILAISGLAVASESVHRFDELNDKINVESENRELSDEILKEEYEHQINETLDQLQTEIQLVRDENQNTAKAMNSTFYQELDVLDRKIDSLENHVIRLVDGGNNYGRIEVLHDGAWGTICDDGDNPDASHLMCRMLGFDRAVNIYCCAKYGRGTGPIWLNHFKCPSTATSIEDCTHTGWGVDIGCDHGEDLSTRCA